MSFLKPQDFATHIGRPYSTVRSHISRGKIFKDDNGYINLNHPTNELYLRELSIAAPKAPEKTPKQTAAQKIKTDPAPEESDGPRLDETSKLTLRKKKADAIKAEHDAELKRIDIEKKTGKLMPTEMVQKILQINLMSVFRSFESSAENIASIYVKTLGGTPADLADITTRMRAELERSIRESKENALKEIKGVIRDYAQTRGRGERK